MTEELKFALNHIAAPKLPFDQFACLARSVGLSDVEIRNDIPGVALRDGTRAIDIKAAATRAGVTILAINALQRFNDWNKQRMAETLKLVRYARDSGAKALVLCPVNSRSYVRSEVLGRADLRRALRAIRSILSDHGVVGLVEPLGFEESSLRTKRVAVEEIDAAGGAVELGVVHDTFHHYLSGEPEFFVEWTRLVHISGIEDDGIPRLELKDSQRAFISSGDVVGNLAQIRYLRNGGYGGPFSFEPFATSAQRMDEIAFAIGESIAILSSGLSSSAAGAPARDRS